MLCNQYNNTNMPRKKVCVSETTKSASETETTKSETTKSASETETTKSASEIETTVIETETSVIETATTTTNETPAPVQASAPVKKSRTTKKKETAASEPSNTTNTPMEVENPTFSSIPDYKEILDTREKVKEAKELRMMDALAKASANENALAASYSLLSSNYKKRGRKPKGGKLLQFSSNAGNVGNEIPNIILHLKCSLSDLKASSNEDKVIGTFEYVPSVEDVVCYNAQEKAGTELKDLYEDATTTSTQPSSAVQLNSSSSTTIINDGTIHATSEFTIYGSKQASCVGTAASATATATATSSAIAASVSHAPCHSHQHPHAHPHAHAAIEEVNQKELWKKINQLKLTFHKGDLIHAKGSGRSACFWDTHDFDTPTIYIPISATNDSYQVYGCFCSPECAVAFLMNEAIDTTTKFERYHLLNSLYGKLYNYSKSIKPAPNPFYLLNKYYGTLNVQEYRSLFKCDQMIYVVNKPMTHILPELYEDNNDFMVNSKIIPNNNLRLKKNFRAKPVPQTLGMPI